jgi:quinol monooxygenase YgiN
MIQHTVCFSLAHEPGSAPEQAFLDDARRILAGIPGVRDFTVARQISPQSPLRFQFSMHFDDRAAYDAYNAHPDHIDFVENRWKPEVADFTEFDFEPLL